MDGRIDRAATPVDRAYHAPGASRWPLGPVALGCLVAGVVSLAVPASIAFDPWTWLVWGREVSDLALDTTGGPSWKPLPVLVTTPLSLLGDLAPDAWVAIARAAGLLAVVLVYRLATRFAGRAAGLLAAALFLLTPDGGPRFLRTLAEGHSAPAEAALALLAVESHLDRHPGRALAFLTALALLRPEAWPFLIVYAAWLWWGAPAWGREPSRRALVVGALGLVPVLWFGGDWWGAGSPLHGAGTAQVDSGGVGERLVGGLDRAAKVVVAPAWVAALAAAGFAATGRDRVLRALGGMAAAWIVLVVGMGVALGYAALSRFLLPAGALLCVLAGVGLVQLFQRVPRGGARVGVLVVAVVVSAPLVWPRIAGLGVLVDDMAERRRVEAALESVVADAGGAAALTRCGAVVADRDDLPQAALAWHLEVPLREVRSTTRVTRGPRVVVARLGGAEARRLRDLSGAVEVARVPPWAVIAVDCPWAGDGA